MEIARKWVRKDTQQVGRGAPREGERRLLVVGAGEGTEEAGWEGGLRRNHRPVPGIFQPQL